MKTSVKVLVIFLIIFFTVHSFSGAVKAKNDDSAVYFTWMSNTNWLVEVDHTKILLDGWITRIPRPKSVTLDNPASLSIPAVKPDAEAVGRVLDSLNINKRLDYIISGHSHFDHSWDTAVWAKLTGAKIIGPKTSCFQAMAQRIPKSQCTIVNGGETIKLSKNLKIRVIKWNHSGNISTPMGLLLQTPMELTKIPKPDPETGGLRPGLLEDGPHGGIRAFLFTLQTGKGKITWLFTNSGNHRTFEKPASIDDAFIKKYKLTLKNVAIIPQKKSVKEHFISAMEAEKLEHLDLWLGYHYRPQVEQVIAILKPKAFLPHHWDDVWSGFFNGLSKVYSNPKLKQLLDAEGITFLPQQQYMDKYRLDHTGLQRIPNQKVKQALGFK